MAKDGKDMPSPADSLQEATEQFFRRRSHVKDTVDTNGTRFVSDASPDIESSRVAFSTPNPFALQSCAAGRVGVLQYDYSLVLHTEW